MGKLLVLQGSLGGGYSVHGVVTDAFDAPPDTEVLDLRNDITALPYDDKGNQFLLLGNVVDGICAYGPLVVDDVGDLAELRELRDEDWVLIG